MCPIMYMPCLLMVFAMGHAKVQGPCQLADPPEGLTNTLNRRECNFAM